MLLTNLQQVSLIINALTFSHHRSLRGRYIFLETTCLGHEGFIKAVAQLGVQAWATQASGHLQAEDQTCIGNTKEKSGVWSS